MANRSYLYAVNFDPTERKREDGDPAASIGEWNYGVPLCFKLLLSVNPREVSSILFDYKDPIAVIGEYRPGLERMYAFIEELKTRDLYDTAELERLLAETRKFFAGIPEERYFVLECGELYQMEDRDFGEQNRDLLKQLGNIDGEIEQFYRDAAEQPKDRDWLLGFGEWSDVLYYSL
ncbi:hypothetical protein [Breznakiella homolactica]|uniref:DUF7822 domain-containing protein n=1 Tax=Breznakiella homolactica TaxID=2798577 RepID=A0A7T8BBD7_9SPIR|nr:hypothetical protein [Breznakiella homolactica]QQO09123.1 hypothetical protein JFL75_19680 [Breznakiella homolactica]